MRHFLLLALSAAGFAGAAGAVDSPQPPATAPVSTHSANPLLGLPPVPVPANNPQSQAKIALGDKLFHDKRFSIDGTISCASCHDDDKAFTDNLPVSVGHHGLTGTRNAPTVINAAFYKFQFWDGREPDLEGQSKGPFINPVEAGLPSHQPILDIVRSDPDYKAAFQDVFNVADAKLTMEHVAKAIASFERSIVAGNSAFDRFYFKGDQTALSEQQKRGFQLFLGQGRCVSCHVIEQDQALFTDNRFHNIGVGINAIQADVPRLAFAFLEAKNKGGDVDQMVLTDKKSSELGRFAVTDGISEMGAFKTPTLRNIALTAPYMHDGSLKTLKEVIIHYSNGGVTPATAPVNPYLSGGIRPLNLLDSQIDDLVAFLESLTSQQYLKPTAAKPGESHE
ncbi:MAG: c-type cytochrome [Methylomonas sp.]|jgi:cytochrome c peroxidase|uniref:cytochrome-c peroxidase n=1 Tax=Methylomonas sp. TaxID=418 RepID=UPI0025DB316B|nr:cytochrome c peroxidase [Methylomonas sp.]MCK9606178.1 c-type cytochrome [Methylomonas sp.]